MRAQLLAAAAILLATAMSAPALAADLKPRVVTVRVTDQAGDPVPNAWVRIPATEGRRAVDPTTGRWSESRMYTLDGEELLFTKGTTLDMTVSAPGFRSVRLRYTIAPRRNQFTIPLAPMDTLDLTDEDDDDLMIRWFRRTQKDE